MLKLTLQYPEIDDKILRFNAFAWYRTEHLWRPLAFISYQFKEVGKSAPLVAKRLRDVLLDIQEPLVSYSPVAYAVFCTNTLA